MIIVCRKRKKKKMKISAFVNIYEIIIMKLLRVKRCDKIKRVEFSLKFCCCLKRVR